MRRSIRVSIIIVGLLVFGTHAFGGAEESRAPLPQGATGVAAAVLAALPAGAADGYELQVFRSEWLPGSSISAHTHPGAVVSCVESGVLTFEIETGSATVTRAHPGQSVPTEIARAHSGNGPEAITPGTPITYGPGDCVAFDEDVAHTVHTAWNAGTELAVLWEAHLFRAGEQGTTFLGQ